MATTPEPTKGVPRIEGNPSPMLRADHNTLADWVRDHVDQSVASVAALPTTGNWAGRTVLALAEDQVHQWKSAARGWVRLEGGDRIAAWGNTPANAAGASPIIQTGVITGTTSGTGTLARTLFPTPFPNFCSVVLPTPNQLSGQASGSPVQIVDSSVAKDGFQTFWPSNPNKVVGSTYLAIGG